MLEVVKISLGEGHLLAAFDGSTLHDILHLSHDGALDIGAIYIAKVERPIKGIGGVFVSLGSGQKGFWRIKNPPREGALVPLQIVQTAIDGKPPRLSERLDFRGALSVLTPGRAGVNASRNWSKPLDANLREAIEKGLPEEAGVILRSEAEFAPSDEILTEVDAHLALLAKTKSTKTMGLIAPALIGKARAKLEWGATDCANTLKVHQKDALHEALHLPRQAAGGTVQIERTQALIAVDIDTGVNTAPTAGRDVNIRSAPALISWLKLMGWGGQLLVDPAPMPMQARKGYETLLQKTAKAKGLALMGRGFGPLGLFEAQIRYTRRPLPADILSLLDVSN